MADFYVPIARRLSTARLGPGQHQGQRTTCSRLRQLGGAKPAKWKHWCAVGITVVTTCTRDSSYSTLCSGFASKGD